MLCTCVCVAASLAGQADEPVAMVHVQKGAADAEQRSFSVYSYLVGKFLLGRKLCMV